MKKSRQGQPQGRPLKGHRGFQHFARIAARMVGRPMAFAFAFGTILIWAILGPIFHFSDTWQLVINTATTIVTFLMVFLIQNTQNRDSEAIQIKLDELLRATQGCHNVVLDIEELSEDELDQIKRGYTILARKALKELRNGKSDIGIPEMEPKVSARDQK
jgi:low affinity Fe/Cu permease